MYIIVVLIFLHKSADIASEREGSEYVLTVCRIIHFIIFG